MICGHRLCGMAAKTAMSLILRAASGCSTRILKRVMQKLAHRCLPFGKVRSLSLGRPGLTGCSIDAVARQSVGTPHLQGLRSPHRAEGSHHVFIDVALSLKAVASSRPCEGAGPCLCSLQHFRFCNLLLQPLWQESCMQLRHQQGSSGTQFPVKE